MKVQSHIAMLCVLLVSAPWTSAQESGQLSAQQSGQLSAVPGTGQSGLSASPRAADTVPHLENEAPRWYSRFVTRYDPKIAPPINVSNSPRLDSLVRAGNLYLSLADAIALALENNIDIE